MVGLCGHALSLCIAYVVCWCTWAVLYWALEGVAKLGGLRLSSHLRVLLTKGAAKFEKIWG